MKGNGGDIGFQFKCLLCQDLLCLCGSVSRMIELFGNMVPSLHRSLMAKCEFKPIDLLSPEQENIYILFLKMHMLKGVICAQNPPERRPILMLSFKSICPPQGPETGRNV